MNCIKCALDFWLPIESDQWDHLQERNEQDELHSYTVYMCWCMPVLKVTVPSGSPLCQGLVNPSSLDILFIFSFSVIFIFKITLLFDYIHVEIKCEDKKYKEN